jgi:hypothetical protein
VQLVPRFTGAMAPFAPNSPHALMPSALVVQTNPVSWKTFAAGMCTFGTDPAKIVVQQGDTGAVRFGANVIAAGAPSDHRGGP